MADKLSCANWAGESPPLYGCTAAGESFPAHCMVGRTECYDNSLSCPKYIPWGKDDESKGKKAK